MPAAYNNITLAAVRATFFAYTGRATPSEWDQEHSIPDIQDAMTQLLSPDGKVYNYTSAGQHTSLDRTYRNDIRRAMCAAGFEGED